MAEEQVAQQEVSEQTPEPHGTEQKPETDWKSAARKWEDRAKANMAKVEELQTQMTEAERIKAEADKAKAEAEAAKAEAERLKAEKARAEAVKATARETGVDADLLALMAGNTPEEIAANAATLKAKIEAMPIYPNVQDGGTSNAPVTTKDEIMSIKDPVARIEAIAANKDLFN